MNSDDSRDRALERHQPHSSEAERSILGNIIVDNELIYQAMEFTKPEHYYVPSNRRIFGVMINIIERGEEITPIAIGEELNKENALDSVGGISYITGLTRGLANENISHLARLVRDYAMLRQLIKAAAKITMDAFEHEDGAQVVLQRAGKEIFDIVVQETPTGFTRVGPLVHQNIVKAHEIAAMGNVVTGLSTGFADLDANTLGLQRQDLIIIAGRPSMGKTAFALMLTLNTSVHDEAVALIFSLEMSKESLGNRLACAEARVDGLRFRNGFLSIEEWGRIHDADQIIGPARIYIDDTAAITTQQIAARCQRLAVELAAEGKRIDLVVVDYLQLMGTEEGRGRRSESRQQDVSQISRELKGLAKTLDVPLVALSQLSRAPETRTDHRPMQSDLRESGAIEQDADLILGLYREDQYKKASDHEATLTGVAEVIIIKNRNGPTKTISLQFEEATGRFNNLYQEQPAEQPG